MEIRVGHTWDGLDLPEEAARLVVEPGPRWRITVDAPFHGDPAPPGPPGPTDRLWEHEVVELFLVGERDRYTEIELGPFGHHLVLQLRGVRRPVASRLPISYEAARLGDRWRGEAWIDPDLLPSPLRAWNAYAIHGLGPARRYCAAVPVPGDAPDFHRLTLFAPWPPRS